MSLRTFFTPFDLVCPLVFVNLPTKFFFFGVTPVEGRGYHPGGPPPPTTLVKPLISTLKLIIQIITVVAISINIIAARL